MDTMEDDTFKYSLVDFGFTFVGLLFFLFDIVLDILAVVSFYQEGDYICLGLLLLFLLGSSVLTQMFSWLWYHYEDKTNSKTEEEEEEAKHYKTNSCVVERCLNRSSLVALHVFQMGVYLRYACIMEVSIHSFRTKKRDPEGIAVFLTHDLSMLRLIETFSESAPQLALMLTIIFQRGHLDLLTMLKATGSASAIACGVTMYHRSLRSFLTEKDKQNLCSSFIYFFWNLLLISARLVAIALFASVLPCYIFTHFLCSWMIFLFFAWRSKTSFMDSPGGEWLFRATVSLIWYFSWFNVLEGQTRYTSILYHIYIIIDLGLLCGLWCLQIYMEQLYFKLPAYYAIIISLSIIAVYVFGLSLKGIYYKFFHPRLAKRELKESLSGGSETVEHSQILCSDGEDTVDFRRMTDFEDREPHLTDGMRPQTMTQKRENKRMRKLAENFYN